MGGGGQEKDLTLDLAANCMIQRFRASFYEKCDRSYSDYLQVKSATTTKLKRFSKVKKTHILKHAFRYQLLLKGVIFLVVKTN